DSYTLQKRNDSSIVAEFEMKNDSGLYTLKQLDGKYRNKTTVVFIEKKDGSRLSFFAKVIEDLSIPGSETVMDELHYRNIPGLFNGMIFYYTLDRQFVNGERYVNGVRTGSVSFKETASGIKVNSKGVNNVVAPCTITDFYSYNCQKLPSGELIDCVYHYLGSVESGNCHGDGDGGSGGYGGDGSGGGVPADPKPCIPAKPNTVDMTEVVKNGKLVIQSMPAPGTGGGTTPTPTPVPCPTTPPRVTPVNNQEFLNQIDDSKLKPCMQSVLARLKNLSGNNVADIIQKFAGTTPGYNWVMKSGSTGSAAAITNSTYNRLTGTVTTTFDATQVSSGSDLAIAKTILHESVHSYLIAYFGSDQNAATKTYPQLYNEWLNAKDANVAHHDEIVRSFMSNIGASLKAYGISQGYKLTDQFYNDLAWGGLQETSTFKKLSQTDKDRIINTIMGEQSGTDSNGDYATPKGKSSGC
ncbi:hypothetical protein, partial [Mucilaginibacter phyllosphaerae]